MREKRHKWFEVHSNAGRKRTANTAAPAGPLVSKGQYLQSIGKKIFLCGMALFLFSAAIYLLTFGRARLDRAQDNGTLMFVGAATIFSLWCSTRLFDRGRKIVPGRPLTKHIASLLPPRDSLVRASDIPPAQPQAELLRAVQAGKETPPEELLRAGQENRQDD